MRDETSRTDTLERMLNDLKRAEINSGFICENDVVWIRGPGAPWTDTPTPFTKADLESAISAGEVRAQTMKGTATWTYYVLA
jgi:hypothetical protein